MERKFNNMFTIHTQHTITHLSIQPQKKITFILFFFINPPRRRNDTPTTSIYKGYDGVTTTKCNTTNLVCQTKL